MTRPDQDRTVLDPRWEDELRAGLEADGGQGSVERELEVLHALRHARAPEPIDESRMDALWSEIEAQAYPSARGTSWWRRRWWVAVVPAATAAAVLLFVVRPAERSDGEADGTIARDAARDEVEFDTAAAPASARRQGPAASAAASPAEESAPSARASGARAPSIYEEQFAALAPRSRAVVTGAVEDGRGKLRAELIADARLAAVPDVDLQTPTTPSDDRPRSRAAGSSSGAGRSDTLRPAEADVGPTTEVDTEADSDARSKAGGGR